MARKPLTPEQLKKIEQSAFSRKVQYTFRNAGFEYLATRDIERSFGSKTGELDGVYLFENVVIICEDTIRKTPKQIKEHLRNKKILCDEIFKDKSDLIDWLKSLHADKFKKFEEYDISRYKVFFLYFTKNKLNLSEEDEKLYQPVRVVEHTTLNYFQKMSKNIRFSARNDFYRFLGLKSEDIGPIKSSSGMDSIETTIIYPNDTTGLKNNVRIVSFMLSAETLISNCYVLRKDNWEDSIALYQRLIEKNRIQSIRKHLATKKTTFFNNIIVSLPRNISFQDKDGKPVELKNIQTHKSHTMLIPNELNSICIIDGQHRIFAHYEGEDSLEKTIKPLRKKFHLLVTGLVFPSSMSDLERTKYESEIFLDINSNAKPVPPDVLLFIETLKDPFSDLGIARQVLEQLNKKDVFHNYFQMSLMEESKIKIASIIKFALKYLVEITSDKDRETLFNQWSNANKEKLLDTSDADVLKEYIKYIVGVLDVYFSALKTAFKDEWDKDDSKILSTTSINGFILALRSSLHTNGLKDFDFYKQAFENFKVDFSKANFEFTSSQYKKFSRRILEECFMLEENDEGKWEQKK